MSYIRYKAQRLVADASAASVKPATTRRPGNKRLRWNMERQARNAKIRQERDRDLTRAYLSWWTSLPREAQQHPYRMDLLRQHLPGPSEAIGRLLREQGWVKTQTWRDYPGREPTLKGDQRVWVPPTATAWLNQLCAGRKERPQPLHFHVGESL
jgi:hypothetical protein